MNRRSFFGLFGGAAVVPFVKVPDVEVVVPSLSAVGGISDERLHWKTVQYGLGFTETDPAISKALTDAMIYGQGAIMTNANGMSHVRMSDVYDYDWDDA